MASSLTIFSSSRSLPRLSIVIAAVKVSQVVATSEIGNKGKGFSLAQAAQTHGGKDSSSLRSTSGNCRKKWESVLMNACFGLSHRPSRQRPRHDVLQ